MIDPNNIGIAESIYFFKNPKMLSAYIGSETIYQETVALAITALEEKQARENPKTNFDVMIKSLTVEKLAYVIFSDNYNMCDKCIYNTEPTKSCNGEDCFEGIIKYLNTKVGGIENE